MPLPSPPAHPRRARAAGTIADVRAALRLAVEGIHGVTHIAQGLHGNILALAPPLGRVREQPAGGISGFVYGTVRLGSSLVGAALDAMLAGLQGLSQKDA